MHPLLFEISLGSYGAYRVSSFGALFALGLAVALVLTLRLGVRAGLAQTSVMSACLAAILTGILGARLGFVLLHPGDVASVSEALSWRSGGLSGPVGLSVGAGVLAWVGKRRRLAPPTLLDAAAPGLAVGLLLTRLGCWLEGCDFGKSLAESAPAWLVRLGTFPAGSPAWIEQVLARAITPSAGAALPVHPSQLYDAAIGALLLGLALVLGRKPRVAGTTAAGVVVAYALLCMLVDLTRAR
jgi:phosphatidylglycerol:prolipoprotein diacylglycerol transferase